MQYRYRAGLLGGVLLILGGLILVFTGGSGMGTTVMLNAGMVMVLVSLVRFLHLKKEPVERDERTRKIAYTSLAASFQMMLFALLLLWWVDYLRPLPLTVGQFILCMVVGMALLMVGFRWHYSRVPDLP
ncbi:MAG: hypothetical protein WCV62_00940 [Candidatus Peribacteraceae bacterium]|jgi:drug/metabolite transporter (DMT)-like permease